jgi:hypothetical protein
VVEQTQAEQDKFVQDYLHTRANSNRIPGTVDVIVADCTEENVNWLRSMREKTSTKAEGE